jgi:hypothetical protein
VFSGVELHDMHRTELSPLLTFFAKSHIYKKFNYMQKGTASCTETS